jgi:hypothetical protein
MALVLTADRRSDGAFGFRMFSESSSMKLVLYREVERGSGVLDRVHVDEGVWIAHSTDRDGMVHRLTWYDRIPAPFWVFDREMHASYGAATQLSRLQGALDDVASHVPNDAETRRFVLEVSVRRNGHEPVVHRLVSRDRMTAPPASPASLVGLVPSIQPGPDVADGGP